MGTACNMYGELITVIPATGRAPKRDMPLHALVPRVN